MDDNIQVYRGPMEVEGPDEFDDDLQYIKESSERRSLKNKDQGKNQNNKNSLLLYGILFIVLGGMIFFNLVIDSEDDIIQDDDDESYQSITKTLLGCPRKQYFNLTQCLQCPEQCDYCEEITGQCLQCAKTYFIDAQRGCVKDCPQDHQKGQLCINTTIDVNGLGGMFATGLDNNGTNIEIPYLILSQKNVNKTIYVFQNGFVNNIEKYIDHVNQANFVIVDDYDLLTDDKIHNIIEKSFIPYIQEKQLFNKDGEIILIAEGEKSQLLFQYLSKASNKYQLAALINPQQFNEQNHKIFEDKQLNFSYKGATINALLAYDYLQPILILYENIEELPEPYKLLCQQQHNRLLADGDFLDKDKEQESKDKEEKQESKDKEQDSKDKEQESKDKENKQEKESKDKENKQGEESKEQEKDQDKNKEAKKQEINQKFICLAMDDHYLKQIIEYKLK